MNYQKVVDERFLASNKVDLKIESIMKTDYDNLNVDEKISINAIIKKRYRMAVGRCNA